MEHRAQVGCALDGEDGADHHGRDRDDAGAQQPADAVELPLQRRSLLLRRLQQRGDPSDLGSHAGGRHHGLPVPAGREGAAEHHVAAVAQPGPGRKRGGVLGDRQAFTRQRGLRHMQHGRVRHPRVGGHGVALLDQDEVAGHEVGSGDAPAHPVPHDASLRRGHPAQRRHGLLGPGLLCVAHQSVEQHDREDRHGLVGQGSRAVRQPQGRRHEGRKDQQYDEDILELGQRLAPGRHGRLRGQLVPAVPGQAPRRLCLAQPALRIGAERGQDHARGLQVRVGLVPDSGNPVHRRLRRLS